MHPARVTEVAPVGELLGFPLLRIALTFTEDGEVGRTEVVGGHAAVALKVGDAVEAWTDDDGVLAGIVHPGWPSTLDDALARVAARLGAPLHRHDGESLVAAELQDHDVVVVLADQWRIHLGVETPFDGADREFSLELRHLFDAEDQLPTEVVVRGDLVVDLEAAADRAGLASALPEETLARIERLAERLDAPLVIDDAGLSITFTPALFDGDLWVAVLEELIALWRAVDAATSA